jgi:diacylglycerol kinase (ATP)
VTAGPQIIVFLNSRSGGQKGGKLLAILVKLLGESNVFDLAAISTGWKPADTLEAFKDVPDVRVMCCGGDGTMGWLLNCIKACGAPSGQFALAMMPLGTGNDLSREFNWGGGFKNTMAKTPWLRKVAAAKPVGLDRWELKLELAGDNANDPEVLHILKEVPDGATTPGGRMFASHFYNYFSIGVDAKIAYMWHHAREKHPERFKSQLGNQAQYAKYGMKAAEGCLGGPPCRLGDSLVVLEILRDGHTDDWIQIEIPPSIRCLVFLNISSYGGGRHLWGGNAAAKRKGFQQAGCADGLIEIVGIKSARDAGCIMVCNPCGKNAQRIAQAQAVRLTFVEETCLQIDGEPWKSRPGSVTIKHVDVATVLHNE